MTALPKAILFDFDGTLADSYPAITASVNHVRSAHGLPALSIGEVKRHVGRALPYLLQHTVPGTDLESDAALYRAHHPSVLVEGTRLLPDVAETLSQLHSRLIKLAVCSNKPAQFTRILVQQLGIAKFLAEVLGPEDAPQPKPAPDMLLAALRRLKVEAKEALYVGDMTVDIQTARAAAVAVWVIPTGSDSRDDLIAARPDRIIKRFSELLEITSPAATFPRHWQ
ncbi:MAG TPA: HAD-IA family hydrolase [Gemmataceae bacterium]|jgi:phosphoglycolate phosphatase|nr:HAD-IA family hydrolase [Gemmataceae bacterium]